MSQKVLPYITHCAMCSTGHIRFLRCRDCDAIIAVCDECRLTWRNLASIHSNPHCPASGHFPACPACNTPEAHWAYLDHERVVAACLTHYMAGESA
jgi:hypothetical protein